MLLHSIILWDCFGGVLFSGVECHYLVSLLILLQVDALATAEFGGAASKLG